MDGIEGEEAIFACLLARVEGHFGKARDLRGAASRFHHFLDLSYRKPFCTFRICLLILISVMQRQKKVPLAVQKGAI